MKFRKPHRLNGFDYSSAVSYFIAFDVKDRKNVLSDIIREDIFTSPVVCLKPYGIITEKYILQIESHYPGVIVDNYVIMPNHVHLLITIAQHDPSKQKKQSDISHIIRGLKSMVTREIGKSIWQLDYYDVIAETEEVFLRCDAYIDDNPAVWLDRGGIEPPAPK